MKKIIFTTVALLFIVSTAMADGGGHDHSKMKHHQGKVNLKKTHEKAGTPVKLTGYLIGMTCYLKHSSSGKKHKSCARTCAEKGLPIALRTKDGKLYIIAGKGHDSLKETYKPLTKYLESDVMVQGRVFEKSGSNMIVIEKIKKS